MIALFVEGTVVGEHDEEAVDLRLVAPDELGDFSRRHALGEAIAEFLPDVLELSKFAPIAQIHSLLKGRFERTLNAIDVEGEGDFLDPDECPERFWEAEARVIRKGFK